MTEAKPYHNTTALSGSELADAEKQATGQEALILRFYVRNAGSLYTPSQVHDRILFQLRGAPITSVRRAISNLERCGLLVKTETQRTGPYGRPEYCWMAASRSTQTELF